MENRLVLVTVSKVITGHTQESARISARKTLVIKLLRHPVICRNMSERIQVGLSFLLSRSLYDLNFLTVTNDDRLVNRYLTKP